MRKISIIILILIMCSLNTSAQSDDFSHSENTELSINIFNSGKSTEIHNVQLNVTITNLNGYDVEIEFLDFDVIYLHSINATGNYTYTNIAGSVTLKIVPTFDPDQIDACGLGPCLMSGNYSFVDLGLHTNYNVLPFSASVPSLTLLLLIVTRIYIQKKSNKTYY